MCARKGARHARRPSRSIAGDPSEEENGERVTSLRSKRRVIPEACRVKKKRSSELAQKASYRELGKAIAERGRGEVIKVGG